MAWKAYEIVFRLRMPLHSGWRKVGNLQMTRPYVTGRMLWGALTMRLTRDEAEDEAATDSAKYAEIGNKVHKNLAFTYFYPALKVENEFKVNWPWENEADFRRRFLGSYASTALVYPQQSASEGSLHEVEFLSPHTIDDGQPVYLLGYIFEKKNGCSLKWREALHRLQLGGERGYGWGRAEPADDAPREITTDRIFDDAVTFDNSGERPSLTVTGKHHLLAHTKADEGLSIEGEIEPLVGREWRSTNTDNQYAGQHVEYNDVCFVPGSRLNERTNFFVDKLGIWKKA